MAHIPGGDIQELWDSAPHSWSGLEQNLKSRRGTAQGISDNLVDDMIRIAQEEQSSGASFPSSPQELGTMLNGKLGAGAR
ncbi:MAG: hypothetical protein ACRDFS_09870 [Chloroflexota bacterium]